MKWWILVMLLSAACSPQIAEVDVSVARPVATISPDSIDFSDLDFMKDLLKDKRIVILGEDAHQNGAGVKAHHRLIKFLTKEMGFSKVLFEYDIYPIWKAQECYLKGMERRKVATELGRRYDWLCDEWSDLYDDLLASREVTMGGYDIAYHGFFGDGFVRDIKQMISEIEEPLKPTDSTYFIQFASAAVSLDFVFGDARYSLERICKINDLVLRDLQSRKEQSWPSIYVQFLKNNVGFLKWAQSRTKGNRKDLKKFYKERDVQMAANVLWWLKAYPNDKFIIHSSDYHAGRNLRFSYGVRTMIDLLTDSIPESEMYTLANITYGGYFGYEKNVVKVPVKMPHSIESELHNKRLDYAILDFNDAKMSRTRKFTMQSMEPLVSKRRKWGEVYDGFFFIDEATSFNSRLMPHAEYLESVGPFACD